MWEIDPFIKELTAREGYNDQIAHIEALPAKRKQIGSLDYRLHRKLQRFIDNRGWKLFKHQADSINLVRSGKNIVIATPTASGKTMCFNMPVFDALARDPEARALYIYPMKALENDQLNTLRNIERETQIQVNPKIYDGDTSSEDKRVIRKESRIILTNPHGLHYYLSWHKLWKQFYSNLKFIIIDESHTYRGVKGSHIALLFRRINRICDYYGSTPQYILSSATIANPAEHSKKLTGKDFHIISEDSSESGAKSFVFWNPPYIDEGITRKSTLQEARNLLAYSVEKERQTLCFAPSRKTAELIAAWSRQDLDQIDPALADRVKAYRAGYKPEERREIERGLRFLEISGVVTTNALELGIDIGSLDCVIMTGYPGSVISTWQQAGRAGRATHNSVVFLIGYQNPLDQYFMNHPHEFFKRSPENAYINLENPYINAGHVMCASNELPLTATDKEYFIDLPETVTNLSQEGLLRNGPKGWSYSGPKRPETRVKLTNISDQTVLVKHYGTLLETMDITQAYREAHEGAVILHQGEPYRVKSLDLYKLEAQVEETDDGYYTTALKTIEIFINEVTSEDNIGLRAGFGKVNVTEYYNQYKLMLYEKQVDLFPLNLPPLYFPTTGFWFTIPSHIVSSMRNLGLDLDGAIHAIEHAMIAVAPLHAMCDPRDLGGVSSPLHRDTNEPTIFIYDGYKGGIGLSEKLYTLLPELLQTTLNLIQDCQCKDGCPSCIYSPKCGNNNEPLSKQAAIVLLKQLISNLVS